MPLLVNLRHLENRNLVLKGTLELEELDFQPLDELVHLDQPLSYNLEVQRLDQSLLIQGTIRLPMRCDCARCLKPFEHTLTLDNWVCHIPLEGEEGAPIVNDCVDLTPYVREDTLLAFPQHPLCEIECSGLAVPAPNRESPAKSGEAVSPVWAELNKLKL